MSAPVQRLRLFLFNREELTVLILGMVGLISQFVSYALPVVGYLGLPLVALVPGYSLMSHVAPRDRISRITMAFPASLLVSSLYGLLLAVLGVLNQITISAGLFLLSLFLMLSSRGRCEYNPSPRPSLSRNAISVLLGAILVSVLSSVGLLILFEYPVGYDAWSYMATSKLVASGGSVPMWLDGSIGQLNFYPPLFAVYMGSLLLVTRASVISLFWAAPVFFGGFFVLTVFGYVRHQFGRIEEALIAALLTATIGSAQFEGLDRAFPVSVAMIAFPALLLTASYCGEAFTLARLLASSGYLVFLWLCFPVAALLAVVILIVDGLRHQAYAPDFPAVLKMSALSIVPAVAYYLPYLVSYGLPRNSFFAPWLTSFKSATIFSADFLVSLFNYSGLVILVLLGLGVYTILQKEKLNLRDHPVLSWTVVSGLVLVSWELLVQARLEFFGAVRFVPFVMIALCILAASWMAPMFGERKLSLGRFHPRLRLLSLGLLALIVASSAAITANANYHEWLPPANLPVSSSYYQAIVWLRDNSSTGGVVLTLDPLAQSLLEDVAGRGIHVTYDLTTYAFWVPQDVVSAYSDTVTMLMGMSNRSMQLLSSYNVSYVLITSGTIQLLSQIKGVSEMQVEDTLTAEFVNSTRFRLVYSGLPNYQTQSAVFWTTLQASSNGPGLHNLWDQLPPWAKMVFRAWLERFCYQFDELTWGELLASVKSLSAPDIRVLPPTVIFSAHLLPVVFEVLH